MAIDIGKKLHELRKKNNLSISECAKKIGVSPSTYRDWEYGRAISGEPYIKIATLFSISLSELFGLNKRDTVEAIDLIEHRIYELLNDVKNTKSLL
tara:strand:- start:303 stop:590 length:288 start_codon:yes stop_codon:yes gene_type:complete